MRQIELYDAKMNYINTLSLDGNGIPYFSHARNVSIESDDSGRQWEDTMTFSMTLKDYNRSGFDPNGWVLWQGADGYNYLYGITNFITDVSGDFPIVNVSLANAFSFSMNQQHMDDKAFTNSKLRDILAYILQNSGWELGNVDDLANVTDNPTEFDVSSSDNAMTAFSQLTSDYRAEVRAYVEIKNGVITKKVDFLRNLHFPITANNASVEDKDSDMYDYPSSTDTVTKALPTDGRTIQFENGLSGFTRSQDNTQIFTRIYLVGKDSTDVSSVNGGKKYVQDADANEKYFGQRTTFSEKTLENDNIGQPQALLDWGKKQLAKYNHPQYTYVVTTAYMPADKMPDLGETNFIQNMDVVPVLTVLAEVIATHVSDTDPSDNSVTYGEFRTLNPTTPKSIQNMLADLKNNISSDIEQAKSDVSVVRPNILYPDGTDFSVATETKRAIAQVYVNNKNVTAMVLPAGFQWSHFVGGAIDPNFDASGYLLHINESEVGTLRLAIDTSQMTTEPEASINQESPHFVGSIGSSYDVIKHAVQYAIPLSDGTFMTCHNDGSDNTWYVHRDKYMSPIDHMIINEGGHGASFGMIDDKTIVCTTYDSSVTPTKYRLSIVAYNGGATYNQDSSQVTNVLTKTSYFRTSYDKTSGLVALSYESGVIDIYRISELQAGSINKLYTFNVKDYGFDPANQTYQSQSLLFPYLIWNSGNANGKDTPMMYCVNVAHLGEEFATPYNLTQISNENGQVEPETVYLDGSGNLFMSFNERKAYGSGDELQYFYTIPFTERT